MVDKHWINTFYVFELIIFLIGLELIFQGYKLSYNVFSGIGIVFILFGMIMSFIQKRG